MKPCRVTRACRYEAHVFAFEKGKAGAHYEANFMLVLAVLMTSVAALVFKVTEALALPRLWANQALLQKEAARLAEKINMFESRRSNIDLFGEGSPASDTNATISHWHLK